MAGHDKHASCEHDVAWCRHCDVIYCRNCEMTWARPCQKFHGVAWQAPYYGNVNQTWPSTLTSQSQTACGHIGGATSSS